MILNPVISGGAEEKVYKITNQNSTFMFPTQAAAGAIVVSENADRTGNFGSIHTLEGVNVPYNFYMLGGNLPTARAGSEDKIYFIMPSSDVTIS